MRKLLPILLLTVPGSAIAQWVEYSTRPNGDVYFYDDARVQKHGSQITVWTRVRYKTSVMAASSFQSHLKLNCLEKSEIVLQSTFFTDKEWLKPAMATNTTEKPKLMVKDDSATDQLMSILCIE